MQLTLGWWNTGLSPTKSRNRATVREREAAAVVVRLLLGVVKVDFLALGEVSEEDVHEMQKLLTTTLGDFVILQTQEKAGRSRFDTSLIHHKRLSVTKRESVVRRKLERTTRVAQRLDIALPSGEELYTYVSHWPSRGTLGAWEPERMMLGTVLRESIDMAFDGRPDAPLVLVGDFNDEPFDPVMDGAILSSRDRALVSKTPRLLYNPFWRHMSCYEHTDGDHQFTDRGTYFHAGGQMTRWRTFDQMMFSASLITGTSGWLLDEHATRVVDVPDLAILLEEKSNVFDHMPIVGRLKRSHANG